MKYIVRLAVALVFGSGLAFGKDLPELPSVTVQKEILKKVAPSAVTIEIYLQYDGAEAPEYTGHGFSGWRSDGSTLVKDERPVLFSGWLLDERTVITGDIFIEPRFIDRIEVTSADNRVRAELDGFLSRRIAAYLKLTEPLKGATPLNFLPDAKPPYYRVDRSMMNTQWRMSLGVVLPGYEEYVLTDRGEPVQQEYGSHLIVNEEGIPVGMRTWLNRGKDESWRGSPLHWRRITQATIDRLREDTIALAGQILPRVQLRLRSPKKGAMDDMHMVFSDRQVIETEGDVPGVIVDARRVVVLADLEPGVTARIERITVHRNGEDPVEAEFAFSLKDLGCFVATLSEPAETIARPFEGDLLDLLNEACLQLTLKLSGEQRVERVAFARLNSLCFGWKNKVYPTSSYDEEPQFLFDREGRVVALPVTRRTVGNTERYWRADWPVFMPLAYLGEFVSQPEKYADKSNVPLSAEEESRIAWIGVELQGLNPQLARANDVADITEDGQFGGLVSFVYPNSPAAREGVEQGDILIRIVAEGWPEPIPVTMNGDFYGYSRAFPWMQLDNMPVEFFDQVPPPWPLAENGLRATLTKLGFGRAFTLEVFSADEVIRKAFTVEQCPTHYNEAPQYKSDALGITVKDLTFEVRRYFQKTEEDPGVILSKVEPGSKAAIAGLKPFEIVTEVNGQAIHNAEQFEQQVVEKTELRLQVLRKDQSRLVRINLPAD